MGVCRQVWAADIDAEGVLAAARRIEEEEGEEGKADGASVTPHTVSEGQRRRPVAHTSFNVI